MKITMLLLVAILVPGTAGAQSASTKIAGTCAEVQPVLSLLARRFAGDPELAALQAGCAPDGQKQMAINDTQPVGVSNSGDSAKWAKTLTARIAMDGYLGGKIGKGK